MKLGIHSKLFLTILLTSIIVVIGMMLFTRWSIHTGFESFIEDRQAHRINQISKRLLDEYEISQSWQSLDGNRRLWLRILLGYREHHDEDEHDDEDDYESREHHRSNLRIQKLLTGRADIWPPEHIVRHLNQSNRLLPFEMRIMLFDSSRKAIFGRNELLSRSRLFPIISNNTTVGYLAVMPGPVVSDAGQQRFLERQYSGLIYIGIGVIALSIIISILLSRRLVRPLQAFRETARALAAGNFDSRVNITQRDELGELAQDINALGTSLKANEEARRQWVADIAHELRTPLTVIQSELEALQAGVRPLDRSAVDSLHEDTTRLGRLINDLYELSVTDLGALSYRKQEIDIHEFLDDFIDNQKERFAEENLHILTDIEQIQGIKIQADRQRLQQLFTNLFDNSLRYTDAGGELHIKSQTSVDMLTVEIMDSSPGVPVEALSSLFDRLYRVDESRNRHTGGSGLGLAIAKNIVEAHEGTIEATPSPLGGLCIRLTFPRVAS